MKNYVNTLFFLTFLLLLFFEILRVYLIMPFPSSQQSDSVVVAHSINEYIWFVRIVLGVLLLWFTVELFKGERFWVRIVVVVAGLLLLAVIYTTYFVLSADKMFYQPETKLLMPVSKSNIDTSRLILGITINGDARAYPIYLIGYHHQVLDTVGGRAVMVTYCTMCRTGVVFQPTVNGKHETFRLVGMDQYNALFEDATTHSWWRQATGECCAGKLKGAQLSVVASEQMSLAVWLAKHPNTLILQPDPKFAKQYQRLTNYEKGADKLEFSAKWRK